MSITAMPAAAAHPDLHPDQVAFLRAGGYSDEQIARFAPWGGTKPARQAIAREPLPPEQAALMQAAAEKRSNDSLWWH